MGLIFVRYAFNQSYRNYNIEHVSNPTMATTLAVSRSQREDDFGHCVHWTWQPVEVSGNAVRVEEIRATSWSEETRAVSTPSWM